MAIVHLGDYFYINTDHIAYIVLEDSGRAELHFDVLSHGVVLNEDQTLALDKWLTGEAFDVSS